MKSQHLRKFALVLVLVLSALPFSAWSQPLKIAMIMGGDVGTFGWSYSHFLCKLAIEKTFSDKVEEIYIYEQDELNEGETKKAMRSLLEDDYKLFFVTSYEFEGITHALAKEYPDVIFEIATGSERADNVGVYSPRFYEGRYSAGVLSGIHSSTGLIGYIGPFPIPEIVRGANAVALGARTINPDAKVFTIWIDAWSDDLAEAEASDLLINMGVDVIVPHTKGSALMEVARNREVLAFAKGSDLSHVTPNAQLASITDDWTPFCINRVQKVLDGNWQSSDVWSGPEGPGVRLTHFHSTRVSEEEISLIRQLEHDMQIGTVNPFTGPIFDSQGRQIVAESQALTDQELKDMDWFVEGVESLNDE